MVDSPKKITPKVSTSLAPYLSTAQPTGGEAAIDKIPPKLAAPPINVLLHPKSNEMGYTKTANVRLPTELRTNIDVPAAATIYQP